MDVGRNTVLVNCRRRWTYVEDVVARRRRHERLLAVEHVLVGELPLRQRVQRTITALVDLRHCHVHQIARREVISLLMSRLAASDLRTLSVRPPLRRRASVGTLTVPGTVRGSARAAVVRSRARASLVVARTIVLLRLTDVTISGDDFNVLILLARVVALRGAHEGLLRVVWHRRWCIWRVERRARHKVLLSAMLVRLLRHASVEDHVGGYMSMRHETRLLLSMLRRIRLRDSERKARQSLRRLEASRVVARHGARSLPVLIEIDEDILDDAMKVYVGHAAVLSLLLGNVHSFLVAAIAVEAVLMMHRLLLRIVATRRSEALLLARVQMHARLAKYLSVLKLVFHNELVDLLRTVRRYDDVGASHEGRVAGGRSGGRADGADLLVLLDHFPLGD